MIVPNGTSAPLGIIAGNGNLPAIACAAALRQGRQPVVVAIAGEADPAALADVPAYLFRWGEIGRLWKILEQHSCREALFIGGVSSRPDLKSIKLDFGAIPILPRVAKLIRAGDDSLLSGIAEIFADRGIKVVSIFDVAPDLALPAGPVTARRPTREEEQDIRVAAEAAAMLGRLDIGQAAVAVGGRVVALEGAEGTDGLIARISALRDSGRIPRQGGVLVKLVKPQQDRRIDLPTIGPDTAIRASAAQLTGVAGTAGATLLAGRDETVGAFNRVNLFLLGLPEHGYELGSVHGRSR